MARIAVGGDGRISLPPDFRGSEVVVERREGGLAVWRAEPDVRRVYIEVTTRCNLDCAFASAGSGVTRLPGLARALGASFVLIIRCP